MGLDVVCLTAGYARPAFQDVAFSVAGGELVGLIGPNGAGKSTLLRVLSGTLAPLAGEVRLAGRPLSAYRVRDLAQHMALVPQQPPDDGSFMVGELVALGRHPYQRGWGWETPDDRRAVAQAMTTMGVSDWSERLMGSLSGGERQRVRIAQALAQEPRLLLLDEPTAWADLRLQLELLALLSQLARAGLAVIAVLHDLNLAAQYCDRLLLLHDGRLAADGAPSHVLTAEAIAGAYGVRAQVLPHPETGAPMVVPCAPYSRSTR